MNMRKSLLLYARYIDNDKIIKPEDLGKIDDLLRNSRHNITLSNLLIKIKNSSSYEESVELINNYISPKELDEERQLLEDDIKKYDGNLSFIGDEKDPDIIFEDEEQITKGNQKVLAPNLKKGGFVDLILLALSTGFMGGVVVMLTFNIIVGNI